MSVKNLVTQIEAREARRLSKEVEEKERKGQIEASEVRRLSKEVEEKDREINKLKTQVANLEKQKEEQESEFHRMQEKMFDEIEDRLKQADQILVQSIQDRELQIEELKGEVADLKEGAELSEQKKEPRIKKHEKSVLKTNVKDKVKDIRWARLNVQQPQIFFQKANLVTPSTSFGSATSSMIQRSEQIHARSQKKRRRSILEMCC